MIKKINKNRNNHDKLGNKLIRDENKLFNSAPNTRLLAKSLSRFSL